MLPIKKWMIKINGVEEGPYSLLDLRRHPRVTPETLVRKVGSKKWVAIRDVPELAAVFEDEESDNQKNNKIKDRIRNGNVAVLDHQQDPSNLLLWILLIVLLLAYIFYLIR